MTILADGTKVSITDGQFKGLSGTVVGYHNQLPITYAVLLDAPLDTEASNVSRMPDGSTVSKSEKVTLTRVEVAESDLTKV